MEALFPIKIDIPDINEKEKNYFPFYREPKRLNFLFTREINTKEININYKSKIYHLGNIIKNDKTISVYYIEIFDGYQKDIEIKILNDSFFIKLDDIKEPFLFNKYLFDKNNKKIDKLNMFDICEEFEINYRIHKEKNNVNSLKLLISSTLNSLKTKKEEINFSLFLDLFIKEHSYLMKNVNIDEILLKKKNNGDLTRISNEALYKIIAANKKNEIYIEIYFIYLILTQKTEIIDTLLKDGCLNELLIFDCLQKYKFMFFNSVQLFPKFTFLLKMAHSLDKIELILRCSKDFVDFFYFLNEGKEFIIKYIDKDFNFRLDVFFDLKQASTQKFDEDFYLLLDSIKQFEIKCNKRFFNFKDIDYLIYISLKFRNAGLMIFAWTYAG